MTKTKQRELAKSFHSLHHQDEIFVLPYVWNGGSARIFEKQRFKAVSTTSAGIAYSMGYSDGENLPFEDLLRVTREIIRAVDLPVSVDMESGYGESILEVVENVRCIIEAGAVGINIEDGYNLDTPYLEDLDLQVAKIKALSKLREEMDIPFFINARTCVFWLKIGTPRERIEEAVKRGNAFKDAGADCFFIPGGLTKEEIQILVEEVDSPINIIANPIFNSLDELSKLGVKRMCIGSGASRASMEKIIHIARELYEENSIETILQCKFFYSDANSFFKSK